VTNDPALAIAVAALFVWNGVDLLTRVRATAGIVQCVTGG
jgi:hypothetical protein